LGAIAQLGERLLCKQEVVGSIPSGSTSRVLFVRDLTCFASASDRKVRGGRVLSDIVKRGSIRKFVATPVAAADTS
jgi:hypothetical protein